MADMTRDEFRQAKTFIYTDIEREIAWASVWQDANFAKTLAERSIPSGGGNFLAALGLLCYTEFAGKLKYDHKGNKRNRKNFNAFFDDLGQPYADFRKTCPDVYVIFRCGLAHENYITETCKIEMTDKNDGRAGIGISDDGSYYLVVERFNKDFRKAFDQLEDHLFPQ